MKKLLVGILVAIMMFAFVGCGGDAGSDVSLVEVTTVEGITLLLPSDLTLQTVQETPTYVNAETGENAAFGMSESGDFPVSAWTEEDVLGMYQSKHADAAVQSFENGIQINGNDALVTSVSFITDGGSDIVVTLVIVTAGGYDYVINFTTGADPSVGSLNANLQTCIDSITIAE